MNLEYHVDVTHRFGSLEGHWTEWEIGTLSQTTPDRVRKLESLGHPLLVTFHYNQGRNGTNGFRVRHGATWEFISMLCAYLTAMPQDEGLAFLRIQSTIRVHRKAGG